MGFEVYITFATAYLIFLHKIRWLLVLSYVVTHAIRAYFFYASGSPKWWLSILPFGTWFNYRETSGVSLVWIILSILSVLSCYYTFILLPLLYVSYSIMEMTFKAVTFECNTFLYAWLPFYRYVVMYKEAKMLMS